MEVSELLGETSFRELCFFVSIMTIGKRLLSQNRQTIRESKNHFLYSSYCMFWVGLVESRGKFYSLFVRLCFGHFVQFIGQFSGEHSTFICTCVIKKETLVATFRINTSG